MALKVSEILDKTTLVITGNEVADLYEGQELLILSIGPNLRDIETPLIVPKAKVEVTLAAGKYVIARSLLYEREEQSSLGLIMAGVASRKIKSRGSLDVDESSMIGNPAGKPIQVGDYVVKASGVSDFVASFQSKKAQK